jgi:tetratricopeptide (TPR) repeat protein
MQRLATLAAALLLTVGAACADVLPINQQPMYGDTEKAAALQSADDKFVAGIEKQGLSRADASRHAVKAGWGYWARRDLGTAMSRFNQAWLLDPENGDAYHGFALVTSMRGGAPAEVERYFRLATSRPGVAAEAHVDYGRFLWTQKRLDDSLAQLDTALKVSFTARNARAQMAFVHYLKEDFAPACTWAKGARVNNDELEPGFLEDMCQRAGTP